MIRMRGFLGQSGQGSERTTGFLRPRDLLKLWLAIEFGSPSGKRFARGEIGFQPQAADRRHFCQFVPRSTWSRHECD